MSRNCNIFFGTQVAETHLRIAADRQLSKILEEMI